MTTLSNLERKFAACRAWKGRSVYAHHKQADTSDGHDSTFEKSFANLCNAFLADKAPSLLDYQVGFQLLERNEDNSKAVGLFGFKVGPTWLYAPMFFLNGDLKGHELLYIKNSDQFVPMKEAWLNDILRKRPNVLGHDVGQNLNQLGVMSPDLQSFSRIPSKSGSYIPKEMLPGVAAFAYFREKDPYKDTKYTSLQDLPTFLKQGNERIVTTFIRTLQAYPAIAEMFDKIHGMGVLKEAVAIVREKKATARNVLQVPEKAALYRYSFGDAPPRKVEEPSEANGGKTTTGIDALRSLDKYIRNGKEKREYENYYEKKGGPIEEARPWDVAPRPPVEALNVAPRPPVESLTVVPRPLTSPDSGGGVLPGTKPETVGELPKLPAGSKPTLQQLQAGDVASMFGSIGTGALSAPATGATGLLGNVGSNMPDEYPPPIHNPGYWERFNNYLNQNHQWIPNWLPGGRGANLLAGLGLAAGTGYMLSRSKKKKSRDDLIDELESKSASYVQNDMHGPFSEFMNSKPDNTSQPKRPKGVLTAPNNHAAMDYKSRIQKMGGVAFITMKTVVGRGIMLEPTDGEKEEVGSKGIAIKDERPDSAVAYEVETRLQLENPHETGVYDLLIRPGGFERCLVLLNPVGPDGVEQFATVVRIEGDKNWLNIHPGHLWVRPCNEQEDYYKTLYDSLETPGELPSSYSGLYMLISNEKLGTVPFEVRQKVDEDDAVITYKVHYRDYASQDRPGWLPRMSNKTTYWGYGQDYERETSCCSGGGGDMLHLTRKPHGRIRAVAGQLYVPEGYRLLTLKEDKDKDGDRPEDYYSDRSDPPAVIPGTLVDVQRAIYEKTAELNIRKEGPDVFVNGETFDKDGALIHLVHNWDLREKQARSMLKEASTLGINYRVSPPGWMLDALKVFIKEAIPGDPMDPSMFNQTTAPPFPSPAMGMEPTMLGSVPSIYSQTEQIPVTSGGRHQIGNEQIYDPRLPDPRTMAIGFRAGQIGNSVDPTQREVFDTSMIRGLLKATGDESTDKYIGDLMKGMDRYGRILCTFYWHNEDMADRYGTNELAELEDLLRTAFISSGEAILKLKQQTIEPFPGEGGDSGDFHIG